VLVVLTVSVTRIGTDSDNEVHYRQKRHKTVNIGLSSNWFGNSTLFRVRGVLGSENNELIWHYIQAIGDQLATDALSRMSARSQYQFRTANGRPTLRIRFHEICGQVFSCDSLSFADNRYV